jgi:hypothetical protein
MQICVLQVPTYTKGSAIYLTANEVKYGDMTINIAGLNLFDYVLILMVFITLVCLMFKGVGRV